MDNTQPTAQEATILSRSENILKRLADFQARLDNRFSRNPKTESETKDRPVIANVLDEILDNLDKADRHLAEQVGFISSDVLPKIN